LLGPLSRPLNDLGAPSRRRVGCMKYRIAAISIHPMKTPIMVNDDSSPPGAGRVPSVKHSVSVQADCESRSKLSKRCILASWLRMLIHSQGSKLSPMMIFKLQNARGGREKKKHDISRSVELWPAAGTKDLRFQRANESERVVTKFDCCGL